MATYRIFGDKLEGGTCRSCHKAVVWVETLKGKKMPVDGSVLELVPVKVEGNPVKGERPVWTMDGEINPSHFATCPQAASHRR